MANLHEVPAIEAALAELAKQSLASFQKKTNEALEKAGTYGRTDLERRVEKRCNQPAETPEEVVQQQRHVIALLRHKKEMYGLTSLVSDLTSIADRYEAITKVQAAIPAIETKARTEFENLKGRATNPEQISALSALTQAYVIAKLQQVLPVERVIEKGRVLNVSTIPEAPRDELTKLVGAMNGYGSELSKAMVTAYDRGIASFIGMVAGLGRAPSVA